MSDNFVTRRSFLALLHFASALSVLRMMMKKAMIAGMLLMTASVMAVEPPPPFHAVTDLERVFDDCDAIILGEVVSRPTKALEVRVFFPDRDSTTTFWRVRVEVEEFVYHSEAFDFYQERQLEKEYIDFFVDEDNFAVGNTSLKDLVMGKKSYFPVFLGRWIEAPVWHPSQVLYGIYELKEDNPVEDIVRNRWAHRRAEQGDGGNEK